MRQSTSKSASDPTDLTPPTFNMAAVQGVLTTDVRVSDLPSGGVVHNFEIRAGDAHTRHVVPVAWYDPSRPPKLGKGDEVVVVGSVRRRWFRAGAGSQSRTELLASLVARAGSPRADRALVELVERLAERCSSSR